MAAKTFNIHYDFMSAFKTWYLKVGGKNFDCLLLNNKKSQLDRKSVVQGKSVDLGGRRIIKKKKKITKKKKRKKKK